MLATYNQEKAGLDSAPKVISPVQLGKGSNGGTVYHVKPGPAGRLIDIEQFSLWYGQSQALFDVTMSVERGLVTAVALNGACAVHDFELATAGFTSEDVEAQLSEGDFGMAEETGRVLNEAAVDGARRGVGLGRAVGDRLLAMRPPHLAHSLLAACARLDVPCTVHVAVGTDIVHMHPRCDGAAVGATTHRDFRLLAAVVADLGDGGVYLNVGSAVLLPEVFLKALTLSRNLGYRVQNFVTANLDFIQHYRPTQNVVRRPVAKGGCGYALTGHHELLVPFLAAILVEGMDGGVPSA
jgi:hypothetical protein